MSTICVFQKVSKLNEPFKGRIQFELFEKHMSANKLQIEWEKSYDYFLIIYMNKFTSTFLPLCALILQQAIFSCLALASQNQGTELFVPSYGQVYPFSLNAGS